MGEKRGSEGEKFNLYDYVSQPLPLIDIEKLGLGPLDKSPKSKQGKTAARTKGQILIRNRTTIRTRMQSKEPRNADSTFERSVKGLQRDEYHNRSLLIENTGKIEKPPVFHQKRDPHSSRLESRVCLCPFRSEDFILTQEVLNVQIPEIPMIYRDYADRLFESGEMYAQSPCIYKKDRPEHYKALIDTFLDPTLGVYHNGDLITSTPCSLHRDQVQTRVSKRKDSLLHSEFIFDSEFEGGNLDKVVKVRNCEFDLFLTPDSNTQGYMQWFYFSVRNVHRGAEISFHIVNFTKNGSQFSRGLKPVISSETQRKTYGTSWTRGGYDISYRKNTMARSEKGLGTYYTLSFTYTFQYDSDTVYFAYSEPYTYTRLNKFLGDMRQVATTGNKDIRYEEGVLSRTVGGLPCVFLTISDHSPIQKKRIGISARVHPGETVGSFMMEGFLKFITSDSEAAAYLRRVCVFYVIPMLNPDGVVCGNTRTGLVGADLNRKWDNPNPLLHPVISASKELLTGSVCFLDLHGHSKKDYCFMYGNSFARKDERFWATRFLPIAMAKLSPHFNYSFCYFFNSHSHDKTARTVLFNEKGVLHSFTLEASFNGSGGGEKKTEFGPAVLREIGRKLGEAVYGLVSLLMKKSGKEVSTQDGVYSLANQLVSRLKQGKFKTSRAPMSTVSVQTVSQSDVSELTAVSLSPKSPEKDIEAAVEEPTLDSGEGSDSDPEIDELPSADKATVETAIQSVIENTHLDPMVPRKMLKTNSKFMYKDPIERVLLRFLGPSMTSAHLHRPKPVLRRRFLEEEEELQRRAAESPVRGSRESLNCMRRYSKVVKEIRRKSNSPDSSGTPKNTAFETYLHFVRAVRQRMVTKFPI